jgi:hypothetical protein
VGGVLGVGTEEAADILDHNQSGSQLADGVGELRPQPGAGFRADPAALTGGGHVLAREAAREHVYGLDGGPVDGGRVAVVGDAGVAVGEDLAGAGVDLGVPGDSAAEDGLHAPLEAAVAAEQAPDPWRIHQQSPVMLSAGR